ncbi:MAG TPA: hypothetical protein VF188_02750 [Longimicrobiales bacterium]
MRHGVLLLLLLLAAGLLACSEADPIQPPEEEPAPEPRAARVDEMRVVKVRGDQAARVPPAGGSADLVAASTMPAWTSEPLVARIEVVQPQASGTAFSLAAEDDSLFVPPGTLVHWRVQAGCGELFATTTATDDSAYTINRWAPGTRAGTCTVEAGRLVGTEIVIDTTWTMQVLPGEPVQLDIEPDTIMFAVGDTVTIPWRYLDEYGNPVGPCDWPPLFRSFNPKIEVLDYNQGVITAAEEVTDVVRAEAQVGPGKCARNGQNYDQVVVIASYF